MRDEALALCASPSVERLAEYKRPLLPTWRRSHVELEPSRVAVANEAVFEIVVSPIFKQRALDRIVVRVGQAQSPRRLVRDY